MPDQSPLKKILITGASSGIGFQSALKNIEESNDVLLPCRNKSTAESTLDKITNQINFNLYPKSRLRTFIMDLSDLNSIDNFISSIYKVEDRIDVLVLNAGLQYTGSREPRFSSQGFELTFATNHLAHHYLTLRLLPLLYNSKLPRIIITASEVHNPNSAGGKIGDKATLKDLEGMVNPEKLIMLDGNPNFSADKAYKDSKLCNILFAKELNRRLLKRNKPMPVIAWAPGLVIPKGKDGFFKYSRKYNELGQLIFAFMARDILRISESPYNAGILLNQLCNDNKFNKVGFKYYINKGNGFVKSDLIESLISKEAHDDKLSTKLWNYTCDYLGIGRELP